MCWIGIPSGGSSNTLSYFMLGKPEKALPKQASRLKHKLLCSLIINIFIKKLIILTTVRQLPLISGSWRPVKLVFKFRVGQ